MIDLAEYPVRQLVVSEVPIKGLTVPKTVN